MDVLLGEECIEVMEVSGEFQLNDGVEGIIHKGTAVIIGMSVGFTYTNVGNAINYKHVPRLRIPAVPP